MQSFFLKFVTLFIFIISVPWLKAQTDPNANPNWDWRIGDDQTVQYPATKFQMYYLGSQGVASSYFNAPWSLWTVWDGLNDNKKEDGWVLLTRDFGTPTRAILGDGVSSRPYFILYNKFRSLLRVFILARANMNFTHGGIIIKFGGAEKTVTLTNLSPIGYAADKKQLVENNTATALCDVVGNDIWVWGDFMMAFDPTIVPSASEVCPRLSFQVIGTVESDVKISGTGTGINGSQKDVRDFMSGAEKGNVTVSTGLPTTVGSGFDFNQIKTTISATQTNWNSWKVFLDDMYDKIPIFESGGNLHSAVNTFHYDIGLLKYSWLVQSLPALGAAAGVVDLFFGGGKKTDPALTAPTFFGVNLSLTGTITTQYNLAAGASVVVPGSKSNPEQPGFGSSVPLLYNNPVGLFNLTSTPILQYKTYYQQINPNPSYPYRPYYDFRVKDGLSYQINVPQNTVLESLDAWIVLDPSKNVNIASMINDRDLQTLADWTQVTNPKTRLEYAIDDKIAFSSFPINANSLKYQTIKGPNGKFLSAGQYQLDIMPDIRIKIKAVFKRTDDLNAIPIVAIQSFLPDFESAGTGNWPTPPEPFSVNVTKDFEFATSEIEQSRHGFIGTDPVSITASATIGQYKFAGWSDGSSALTRTFTSNTNIRALYKIPARSNYPLAFANNSQRKYVKTTDGSMHLVYESMGKVWYERSTDNGTTWQIMNNGKPVTISGKNPAIDNFYDWENPGSHIVIVYLTDDPTVGLGTSIVADYYNNGIKISSSVVKNYEGYGMAGLAIAPVVATKYDGRILVAWSDEGTINYRFGYALTTDNPFYWYNQPTPISTTTAASQLTIAGCKSWGATPPANWFQLAWQENDAIYYTSFSVPVYNQIVRNSILNMSSNHYAQKHMNPSVIEFNGEARIVWKSEYDVFDDGEYISPSVVFHSSDYPAYWNFGNYTDVNSPVINRPEGVNAYVFGWTENNGSVGKLMDNYLSASHLRTISATGKDMQLSNGSSLSNMYALQFNNTSLPYNFNRSNSIGSYYGLQKENSNATISVARTGVAIKEKGRFFYSLGDIYVDNGLIEFEELDRNNTLATKENLTNSIVSKPFVLGSASSLTYSVTYGMNTMTKGKEALGDNGEIHFSVEVLDAATNEVIGAFDEMKYSKMNLAKYSNIGYKVNAPGLLGKTIKLRLHAEDNLDAKYVIVENMQTGTGLAKKTFKEVELKQNKVVTDYGLNQNYPNPFNPATTITYQLPKSGSVTLKIYDMLGKEVMTLVNEQKDMGRYTVQFDASSLASGMYVYQLRANEYTSTKKMLLLK